MAPVAVRFHPAAAQEAESAYDWYAARDLSVAHGFREELRHAVDAVADNPRIWPRAMEVGLDVTSFRDFRSAWYTYCARTRSKSSLWLTVDDGPATGDPESDSPSNVRMQRAALRAAR
jgi:plasmid stabilization system protein ParE